MAMQISGVTIQGGMNILPAGGSPSPSGPTDPNFSNVVFLFDGDGTNGAQNNTFVDGSSNGYTVTENGTVIQGSFSPFNLPSGRAYTGSDGGSAYFNDAYLQTPNSASFNLSSGDWTMEGWIYAVADGYGRRYVSLEGSSNSFGLIRGGNNNVEWNYFGTRAEIVSSTNSVPLNTWVHFALVSNSSNIRLYLDGVSQGTTTNYPDNSNHIVTVAASTERYINTSSNVYISNLRIVKGTEVYTSAFTPPTSPLTAIANTELLLNFQDAAIFDYSGKHNIDTVGDAQINTSIKKFGTGSIKFDGTDDRLTCAPSTDFEVGTGDFTIEGWAYNAGDKHSGLFQISGTSGGLQPNNTLNIAVGMRKGPVRWQMYTNGAYNDAASATWSPNTWYHFAMVRSSGVAKLYVDGTEVISVTDTNNYTGTNIVIGGYYSTGYLFDGYIDDFRVTKGVARYTSNFTAPTAAFPTS